MKRFSVLAALVLFAVGIYTHDVFAESAPIITEEELQAELPAGYASWPKYEGTCSLSDQNAGGDPDLWRVSTHVPFRSQRHTYQLVEIIHRLRINGGNSAVISTLILYETGPQTGDDLDVLKMYFQKSGFSGVQKLDYSIPKHRASIEKLRIDVNRTLFTYCREFFEKRNEFLDSVETK